jgi:Na+-translocating ferredoxin:NAD+ oxidoreductase RnfE subunit
MSPPIAPEHDLPAFPSAVVDLFAGVVMTIVGLLTVAITTSIHQTLGFFVGLTALVCVVYAIGYTFIGQFGGDRP